MDDCVISLLRSSQPIAEYRPLLRIRAGFAALPKQIPKDLPRVILQALQSRVKHVNLLEAAPFYRSRQARSLCKNAQRLFVLVHDPQRYVQLTLDFRIVHLN